MPLLKARWPISTRVLLPRMAVLLARSSTTTCATRSVGSSAAAHMLKPLLLITFCPHSAGKNVNHSVFYKAMNNMPLSRKDTKCLKKIQRVTSQISLTVIKFNKELGMSRPCNRCLKFMKILNVKNVTYSTKTGFVTEKVKNMKPLHNPSISSLLG